MSNTVLQFEDPIMTVAEMAKEAGVTVQTINKALADNPDIAVTEVKTAGRPSKGLLKTTFQNELMPILAQNKLRQGNENDVSLLNLDLNSILLKR